MKYCSKCGKVIMDEAVICIHCGCSTTNNGELNSVTATNDAPDTGFAILGFLIPIVGLILYLVNKDKSPKKARSAGKGALIGFCFSIVAVILYVLFAGALLASVY